MAAALRWDLPRWEAALRRWVLASSPRHGVAIDAATRDHVWVLVRLCLKAAASEACCSLERSMNGVVGGSGFDPMAVRFECPRLVEGVSWLGAQLAILYGEGSGRSFAIAAVREAILQVGSCLAVGVGDAVDSGSGGEAGASGGSGVQGSDSGNVEKHSVPVAQVAAAIVALYERFSLEEKIKALRAPHPSKYQLLLEYSQALQRGHEERSKRPNYRAVLEYDGIISRRVDSQESDRAKTREELLAEERDYKRRRMSYRGKKVKRNPKEVLRDIIDAHMEEIKQAGGIGCLLDVPGDIAQSKLKHSPHEGTYHGSYNPTSSSYDNEVSGLQSVSCEKLPCADSFGIVSSRNHGTRDSYKDLRNGSHQRRYQKVSDNENRRSKDSESKVDQRYSRNHENSRHERNSDDHRKYGYKYNKDGSDYYSESTGCTRDRMSRVRSNDMSIASHTRRRSVSVTQDKFSDRYDPQNPYSDVDPATSMFDDGSAGQPELYHDGMHHRRKRDCQY
ncbi:U11/U12 small nuclear ribonucleoprotein 48 kDa protein [Oryza brachyantha]|uniref:CHHC U11-48K-type domain-containing protein n=1 Tax=Oryza brachyantha TaxID=4533 RepID=J3LWX8_ORYBR|nr:U11/U12 small nuclear ribonucleoprotein 48 kDa protein [Oryza brachyantha]